MAKVLGRLLQAEEERGVLIDLNLSAQTFELRNRVGSPSVPLLILRCPLFSLRKTVVRQFLPSTVFNRKLSAILADAGL